MNHRPTPFVATAPGGKGLKRDRALRILDGLVSRQHRADSRIPLILGQFDFFSRLAKQLKADSNRGSDNLKETRFIFIGERGVSGPSSRTFSGMKAGFNTTLRARIGVSWEKDAAASCVKPSKKAR